MKGRLAAPAFPALPPDLVGWHWERTENQQRLVYARTGWATPWQFDDQEPHDTISTAQRYLRVMELDPMETLAIFSPALQSLASRYVQARKRTGEAMLDAAHCMNQARKLAQHGQWHAWLESVGTSPDTAEQLCQIWQQANHDPRFAERIRDGFLSQSTAGLLARPSTPPAVVEAVLAAPESPSARDVKQAIKESKVRDVPAFAPGADRLVTDGDLCTALRESISCGQEYIPKGKIRRPVEYDGVLWIGTGDAVSLVRGSVDARRLCPRAEWHDATYSYSDKSRMGVHGRDYYTGIVVAYRQDQYILTADVLTVYPPQSCYDCRITEGVIAPPDGLGAHLCPACLEKRGVPTTRDLSAASITAGWTYKRVGGSWEALRPDGKHYGWYAHGEEGRAQAVAAIEQAVLQPLQLPPAPPDLPSDLAGWSWEHDATKLRLTNTSVTTNWWASAEECIDDAREIVAVAPVVEDVPELPADLASAGWQLKQGTGDYRETACPAGQWYATCGLHNTQGYATPAEAIVAAQSAQERFGTVLNGSRTVAVGTVDAAQARAEIAEVIGAMLQESSAMAVDLLWLASHPFVSFPEMNQEKEDRIAAWVAELIWRTSWGKERVLMMGIGQDE